MNASANPRRETRETRSAENHISMLALESRDTSAQECLTLHPVDPLPRNQSPLSFLSFDWSDTLAIASLVVGSNEGRLPLPLDTRRSSSTAVVQRIDSRRYSSCCCLFSFFFSLSASLDARWLPVCLCLRQSRDCLCVCDSSSVAVWRETLIHVPWKTTAVVVVWSRGSRARVAAGVTRGA